MRLSHYENSFRRGSASQGPLIVSKYQSIILFKFGRNQEYQNATTRDLS